MQPRLALQSRLRNLKQENPMNANHYIGFDVHKKTVSYCVKTADGCIVEEGKLRATHQVLRQWSRERKEPWRGAMEATLFSGWIYDALKPFAEELQMGHPAMMKAIRRVEEEERQTGCAKGRRPGAVQLTTGVLRSAYGDPGTSAAAALSQPGGGAGSAHEKQDERAVDGSGRRVQQGAITRKEILHGIAGQAGRSAGIGERHAAAESGRDGDVRGNAAATTGEAPEAPAAGQAGGTTEEHSGSGRGDGADVGAGSGRPAPTLLYRACGKLLRLDLRPGILGRQTTAGADLQAAQRSFADGTDRGGETGAAVEPAVGSGAHAGTGAGRSESGYAGGGAETGGLSVGGGQIRPAVPTPCSAARRAGGRENSLTTYSELTSGKGCFPTKAARRSARNARTVLAVKGSLRRAKSRRALDVRGKTRMKKQE